MASLAALGAYKGSDSESDDENKNCQNVTVNDQYLHLTAPPSSSVDTVSAAPNVVTKYDLSYSRCIDTKAGEIVFNPTAEELYTPEQVIMQFGNLFKTSKKLNTK